MNHLDITRRHDFVLLFDCTNGNPNGDPDAGNLPRVDPETMLGLVTDVCLKRKVRNFVDMTKGQEEAFKIYVQSGVALNANNRRAYTALNLVPYGTKQPPEDIKKTRAWMCANFYDIRMFGAVMSTGVNCGQVLGPLQLTFARSIDPVLPLDLSITRVTVTDEADLYRVKTDKDGKPVLRDGKPEVEGKQSDMGRKSFIPYGLYRVHGFLNPHFAAQTGVTEEDLGLFWQALVNMWDFDRSASRGEMSCRGLYIFSHESKLGNAPAHKLFDLINVEKNAGVETPRSFQKDYSVSVDENGVPEGVSLTSLA